MIVGPWRDTGGGPEWLIVAGPFPREAEENDDPFRITGACPCAAAAGPRAAAEVAPSRARGPVEAAPR